MKFQDSLKTMMAATILQSCVPKFGPTYTQQETPQEDYLPKPNTAYTGLDSVCYRTITNQRDLIINCIRTKSENHPHELIHDLIKEQLALELNITQINPNSNIYRINNIPPSKSFEILRIVRTNGFHAYFEAKSQNIIFY